MSKFQLGLLVIFGVFILAAVAVFSLTRSGGSTDTEVVVWGDIPASEWSSVINSTSISRDKTLRIAYVEKSSASLSQEFTEALAEGRGPDLVLLPLEDIWSERNRLQPIPYSYISELDFKNTFIQEGELLLLGEGIYALPLYVDPLVLYYNRDHLTRAAIARPIAYWDEIYQAADLLTEKDAAGNITKSVVALGAASNIPHFKDILSLLMLQAGTPITSVRETDSASVLRSALTSNPGFPTVPAEASLDFYTQFSNPTKAFYSWNRSLLPAQTHFTAGDSTYYLGFASEHPLLRAKNPTLNFSVAPVPQSRVSERSITLGDLRAIAISRGSKNPRAAYSAAVHLASPEFARALSDSLGLPPARRDLLSTRPGDAALALFYDASLQSAAWIDPDPAGTETIFREMIESVTSGRARLNEALSTANRAMESLTQ